MSNENITYSDAIDEYQVREVDDTKPEQKASELAPPAHEFAHTPQQAMGYIMPNWQRQAILNSINVYPQQFMQQQCMSLADQFNQQMAQNCSNTMQQQANVINGTLTHSLEDMNEGLQAVWRMLDKMSRGL